MLSLALLALTVAQLSPGATSCANPSLPAGILAGPEPISSAPPLLMTTAQTPRKQLMLAVAKDELAREVGLMCVLRLRPQHGMLFVFDGNLKQEFWMKNTLIPLDMVWVRSDGTVDTVAANVPASTLTESDDKVARRSGKGKYVVELAAGEAAIDGITVGSAFRLGPGL